MEDRSYCNCCVNRDTDKCSNCYQTNSRNWTKHVNFCPKAQFAKYFHHAWIGMNDQEYMWNSTNCDRPATQSVIVHNKYYCPYCSNSMFPIQDSGSLSVTGYTCFCEGASAQLEYDQEKETMLKKHEQELIALKSKYKSKMAVDLHSLFDIKQKEDRRSFEFFNKDSRYLGFGENKVIDLEDLL